MAKALIVGIGEYPFRDFSIHGDSDASFFANELVSLRPNIFTKDNVRLLLNSRATLKNINERLDWLLNNAKQNEPLVFYFSGGAALVTGREESGDVSGQAEPCLVPYDVEDTKAILLSSILSPLRGSTAKLTVIIDCAFEYYGTYAKHGDNLALTIEDYLDKAQAKVVCPPVDVAFRRADKPWSKVALKMNRRGVLFYPGGDNPTVTPMTLTSTKAGGRSGSLFTDFLCNAFDSNKNASYLDAYNAILKLAASRTATFTPRISFGSEDMKTSIIFT